MLRRWSRAAGADEGAEESASIGKGYGGGGSKRGTAVPIGTEGGAGEGDGARGGEVGRGGDGVGEERLDLRISLVVTVTETLHGIAEHKRVMCILGGRTYTARRGTVCAARAESRGTSGRGVGELTSMQPDKAEKEGGGEVEMCTEGWDGDSGKGDEDLARGGGEVEMAIHQGGEVVGVHVVAT